MLTINLDSLNPTELAKLYVFFDKLGAGWGAQAGAVRDAGFANCGMEDFIKEVELAEGV